MIAPPARTEPRRGARRAALAGLALAALAAAAPARAAPAPLPAHLWVRGGHLQATLDLSSVFPAALEKQLGNGLTNLVAIYVTVSREEGGPPAALYGEVIEILFDVWDETYAVTVKDWRTPAGARRVLSDYAALRRLLSDAREVDLGAVGALPPGRLVVEARVEVNPVSKEQLQRTREYIANPTAGARAGGGGGGGSRSVLGAVASFLLRDPDPGTDVHLLRSAPFSLAQVSVR
ncbi:conserved hypothetical protein [Anaeromyxobacter sp. K]|uniref:hypothetical protein n=1 Tax=Anaeromyxobacter sp. (strain K) TaxID=447217 RepID=UPI00015F9270|nr:hypothetical protein [Anaeromyxobacter sp. K]ACG72364.1 conserved hypothetical protein [Anaeromyxobacter sp. K]